jgi:hypothetical protein
MGRNKPRAKAVDVTKRLLQPTSVTDHIAVQIASNVVIQVAEDDLSPTQGSEAAFALRREGKLDTTMKLCLNWRQGNCHNHAACSFAHVVRFFGVAGDSTSASATGKAGTVGTTTTGGTYSNAGTVVSGVRGGISVVGAEAAHPGSGSWSQKLSPLSNSAPGSKGMPPHQEEQRAVPPSSTSSPSAAAAVAAPAERVEAPEDNTGAAPTQAKVTLFATQPAQPSATLAMSVPTPPAVVSADGLRSILLSLSTSVAAARPNSEKTTAAAEGADVSEQKAVILPEPFLSSMAAATSSSDSAGAAGLVSPSASSDELMAAMCKLVVGPSFAAFKCAEDVYMDLPNIYVMTDKTLGSPHSTPDSEHANGPGAELRGPAVAGQAVTAGRFFSTAPTAMSSVTSSIQQLGSSGIPLTGAHAGELEEGDQPVPGISYQHLMNMFPPDE